jgi:hypothetical protein
LIAAIAALLFFCRYAELTAAAAPSFSSLPTQSTFALTNPVILVSPATLDFGSVPMGERVTKDFLVENIGRGKLVGAASVQAPFKIISGAHYVLTDKEIQVVTVAYTPGRARTETATVKFTGGGGAKTTVTAKRPPDQE